MGIIHHKYQADRKKALLESWADNGVNLPSTEAGTLVISQGQGRLGPRDLAPAFFCWSIYLFSLCSGDRLGCDDSKSSQSFFFRPIPFIQRAHIQL